MTCVYHVCDTRVPCVWYACATRVTRMLHACDMRGPFKLWVICTVFVYPAMMLGNDLIYRLTNAADVLRICCPWLSQKPALDKLKYYMLSTFNKVMTVLLQWYQLKHLDCSIKVYCHNISVPLITCHQHSHNCVIRMLSINFACSITFCHMSSTQS